MEPLTPAVFHILLALADGEKHGYGIMLEVSASTEGAFTMGPGTLYGTLKRMLAAELIKESGQRRDSTLDTERRRYYRITPKGRTALRAEAERLDMLVQAATAKSLLKRPRHA
jgi:DNA-binding PadR family transcriptional regulator